MHLLLLGKVCGKYLLFRSMPDYSSLNSFSQMTCCGIEVGMIFLPTPFYYVISYEEKVTTLLAGRKTCIFLRTANFPPNIVNYILKKMLSQTAYWGLWTSDHQIGFTYSLKEIKRKFHIERLNLLIYSFSFL